MAAHYHERVQRAQAEMARQDVDALVIGVGSDLIYFAGYPVHPSSRPTLLLIPKTGEAQLMVPVLEAPRVKTLGIPFALVAWSETDNPTEMAAHILRAGGAQHIAAGDELWARWLVRIQNYYPEAQWSNGGAIVRELRMRKDAAEIEAMTEASHRTDAAWQEYVGSVRFAGLTERHAIDLLVPILEKHGLVTHGGICASGPNSASPHHSTGERIIQTGDAVVFDFGGTYAHYHSDIARMVHVGEPSDEYRTVYDVVLRANMAAFDAVKPGVQCQNVDKAARDLITAAGYGEYFIHRVGHGLGLDIHEEPYLVSGNALTLEEGMTFSDEPGIYMPGKFGVRIEDACVCLATGGMKLNEAPRELLVVE